MPLLTRYLIDIYTWRGTFVIMAGIALQAVVSGALFRPIKAPFESKKKKTNDKNETKRSFAFHKALTVLKNI